MKRVLSLALSILMLVSIVGAVDLSSYAQEETPASEFTYWIDKRNSRVVLGKYNGKSSTVTIPSEIEGYPVTSLRSTFYNNDTVEEVIFSETVTILDQCAFVFANKLKALTIPKGIEEIKEGAIYSCSRLENIFVEEGNESYNSIGGVLFDKYRKLVAYPTGNPRTSYSIENGTRGVFPYVFYNCKNLKRVNFPDTIVGKAGNYIGNSMFKNCTNLSTVRLAKNMRYISNSMFANCRSLKSITLTPKILHIYGNAFRNCTALEKISMPYGLKSIDVNAFDNCSSLKSVTIPDSVTQIGSGAFKGCIKLTSVDIPKSVEYVTTMIFGNCKSLKYIRILNPNMQFEDNWYSDHVGVEYVAIGDMPVIYGYKGSTAEKHAAHFKNIQFKPLTNAKGYKVTLSSVSYQYDGKVKKPTVTVKDSKGNRVNSSSYSVIYSSGRKNVGKYTVKVVMKGKYVGEFTRSFTIKPRKTSITSVKGAKNGIAVHWKKTAGVTGYQLQYSTSKSFSNPKYIKLDDSNRSGKSITGLKAGKTYYVRVRTYKTVMINGKKTNICSDYSKAYSAKAAK